MYALVVFVDTSSEKLAFSGPLQALPNGDDWICPFTGTNFSSLLDGSCQWLKMSPFGEDSSDYELVNDKESVVYWASTTGMLEMVARSVMFGSVSQKNLFPRHNQQTFVWN